MTPEQYRDASYIVLQQERQVLSCMARSDYVVHSYAYGVVEHGPKPRQPLPCLLLELGEGSVQQKLDQHQAAAAAAAQGHHIRPTGLPNGEVWRIMRRVMSGVFGLDEAGIAWKDVKPSNIVYAARRGCTLPVLCDFGSSALVGPDGLEKAAEPGGTSAFAPPELRYGRRVGRSCDVWGVGCLLLALRLGREVQLLPDVEPDGAAASWNAAAVLSEYEELLFVAFCLTYDASARPSVVDVLNHEYLQSPPVSVQPTRPAGSANHAMFAHYFS
jgi:serine/threonine protein kinase